MPEFYIKLPEKSFPDFFFWGGGTCPPCLPVSYAYGMSKFLWLMKLFSIGAYQALDSAVNSQIIPSALPFPFLNLTAFSATDILLV